MGLPGMIVIGSVFPSIVAAWMLGTRMLHVAKAFETWIAEDPGTVAEASNVVFNQPDLGSPTLGDCIMSET